jgi:hypothetical protein
MFCWRYCCNAGSCLRYDHPSAYIALRPLGHRLISTSGLCPAFLKCTGSESSTDRGGLSLCPTGVGFATNTGRLHSPTLVSAAIERQCRRHARKQKTRVPEAAYSTSMSRSHVDPPPHSCRLGRSPKTCVHERVQRRWPFATDELSLQGVALSWTLVITPSIVPSVHGTSSQMRLTPLFWSCLAKPHIEK